MTDSGKTAPIKSGEYISFETIKQEADLAYGSMGVSDLYSTGIDMLDEYLNGGYGRKNLYELVLISSAPKCLKTTFAMQMLIDPLKRKVPMYWMLAEMSYGETMNMIRAFFYPNIEEADRIIKEAIDCGALKIAHSKTLASIESSDALLAEMKLAAANGAKIFYADPLNYLTKRAARGERSNTWDTESEFIDKAKEFLKDNNLTAVFVVHNTKDANLHHELGMAGSGDLSRIATKTIETRIEGRFRYKSKEGQQLMAQVLSVELWAARGQQSWRNYPFLLKVTSNPNHKGIKIEELRGEDYSNPDFSGLSATAPDKKRRHLWDKQAELMEGCNRTSSSDSPGSYK